MNGSYIAIKNNKLITSSNKKEWFNTDGTFIKYSNNKWYILYQNESNMLVNISYNNGLYTLVCNKNKLYSNDGINWINKTI